MKNAIAKPTRKAAGFTKRIGNIRTESFSYRIYRIVRIFKKESGKGGLATILVAIFAFFRQFLGVVSIPGGDIILKCNSHTERPHCAC